MGEHFRFAPPSASPDRLGELLIRLGKRAGDFLECFDSSSEWCMKYADLMLRGMEERPLEYGERHHVVPYSFYRSKGVKGSARASAVCNGNMTTLSFPEHLFAHYCASMCALGDMRGSMAYAFNLMYSKQRKKCLRKEADVLSYIESVDVDMIRLAMPNSQAVESDGRVHYWEDPVLAVKQQKRKSYVKNIDRNRESGRERARRRRASRTDEEKQANSEYQKEYRETHRSESAEYARQYASTHQKQIKENMDRFLSKHPGYNSKHGKKYHAEHREEQNAYCREYRKRKIEQGYRYRLDKETGKHRWVFVGLPEISGAA
jgi:hypothetical protein